MIKESQICNFVQLIKNYNHHHHANKNKHSLIQSPQKHSHSLEPIQHNYKKMESSRNKTQNDSQIFAKHYEKKRSLRMKTTNVVSGIQQMISPPKSNKYMAYCEEMEKKRKNRDQTDSSITIAINERGSTKAICNFFRKLPGFGGKYPTDPEHNKKLAEDSSNRVNRSYRYIKDQSINQTNKRIFSPQEKKDSPRRNHECEFVEPFANTQNIFKNSQKHLRRTFVIKQYPIMVNNSVHNSPATKQKKQQEEQPITVPKLQKMSHRRAKAIASMGNSPTTKPHHQWSHSQQIPSTKQSQKQIKKVKNMTKNEEDDLVGWEESQHEQQWKSEQEYGVVARYFRHA